MDNEKNEILIRNNINELKEDSKELKSFAELRAISLTKVYSNNENSGTFSTELKDILKVDIENKSDIIVKKQLKPVSFRLTQDTLNRIKNLNLNSNKTMDEELLELIDYKYKFDDISKLTYGLKVWREEFIKRDIFDDNIKHLYEHLDISSEQYDFIQFAGTCVIEFIVGCDKSKLFNLNSIESIDVLVGLLLKIHSKLKSCKYLATGYSEPAYNFIDFMIKKVNDIIEKLKEEVPSRIRQDKIICRLCLQTLNRDENYEDLEIKDLIKQLRCVDYSEISDILV